MLNLIELNNKKINNSLFIQPLIFRENKEEPSLRHPTLILKISAKIRKWFLVRKNRYFFNKMEQCLCI
jgi:hypothetical protein